MVSDQDKEGLEWHRATRFRSCTLGSLWCGFATRDLEGKGSVVSAIGSLMEGLKGIYNAMSLGHFYLSMLPSRPGPICRTSLVPSCYRMLELACYDVSNQYANIENCSEMIHFEEIGCVGIDS